MATIQDVAKLAKVSPATVSNAFNWPEKVKPETRARIFAAVETLGYQPNLFAQGLSSGRTLLVGLLISDIRVPLVANIVRGLEDGLTRAGYMPIIASTGGDSDKTIELVNKLQRQGACGFVIVPAQYGISAQVADALETIEQRGIPTIVTGNDVDALHISNVAIGGKQASFDLTKHLIELGHQDIAFISTFFSRGLGIKRWQGFKEAMEAYNVPLNHSYVVEIETTVAETYAAMETLMQLEQPPTAIFAMNGIYARGVVDYIMLNQIEVPASLSLVTFDYQALAQRTTPRITSVVISSYELGMQTADLFIEIKQDPTGGVRRVQCDYRFALRETTAPPRLS